MLQQVHTLVLLVSMQEPVPPHHLIRYTTICMMLLFTMALFGQFTTHTIQSISGQSLKLQHLLRGTANNLGIRVLKDTSTA